MVAKKWRENDFWPNIADDCVYPVGKKFHRNGCISNHFRDKCVFAFYAEIQYGCQKWRENHFWQKVADNSTHTLRFKTFVDRSIQFVYHLQDKCLFPFSITVKFRK